MAMFKPPIGTTSVGDATTLNGKSEGQLSVASAASATGTNNDEFIISQTNESPSSKIILNNGDGILNIINGNFENIGLNAAEILGTSITSDAIYINDGVEGSCDLSWDQSSEYCYLQTGTGMGRHGPILYTGELIVNGNNTVGTGNATIWFEDGGYKLFVDTSDGAKLIFNANEIWDAGNLDPSSFATTGDLTSKVTYHGSAASAPSEPAAGDEYYDTDDSKFYKYNGSSWVALN
jgi:hypothetical protein